jgi:hypothetical protein
MNAERPKMKRQQCSLEARLLRFAAALIKFTKSMSASYAVRSGNLDYKKVNQLPGPNQLHRTQIERSTLNVERWAFVSL